MKAKNLSVREWQTLYQSGAFHAKERIVQICAGWHDWFCQDCALAGRLKRLAFVVARITNPFVLDNFHLKFRNHCPEIGPLYDSIRFEPLGGNPENIAFCLLRDSPRERKRWTLYTERIGKETPEFSCGDARRMARYINNLGEQLAKATPPKSAENGK